MQQMHWTWEDLERTPPYVKRYCADFLALRAEAAARKHGKPQG